MTAFVIAISVLVLLALALVVPIMLRRHELEADTRDQLNIRIAKDRLAELRQDLSLGAISQQEFDLTRQELEKTLALDLAVNDQPEAPVAETSVTHSSKAMAVFLGLAVPLLALLIYAQIGSFQAVEGEPQQMAEAQPHAAGQPEAPQMTMEEAIVKLRQRLEAEPENAEGWFMLARTYAAINEYDKAIPAYEKVLALVGEDDAGLLLRYADALAMNEGGRLSGAALPYINKALVIDPQQPQGLWMQGMAQNEQGEYRQALESWYQVLPMLQDPRAEAELRNMINAVAQNVSPDVLAEIENKYQVAALADSAPAAMGTADSDSAAVGAQIQVTVSLDASLKDKVSPGDTVFIFARAVSGPPMPLAAVKQPASALPLTVTLTDAMAMMPAMKLSMFEQVTVGAKISSAGTAGPAPGDLFGEQSPVDVGAGQSVNLVIDQVR
jgi:cytochrome c-type biogenesis protein CcmH